jgi:virginiamycin B lyase
MRIFPLLVAGALTLGAANNKRSAETRPAKGIKTPGVAIPFASLKAEAEVTLTNPATAILAAGAGLNLLVSNGDRLDQIETKGNKLSEKNVAGLGKTCGGIVSGFGSVWIPDCQSGSLQRVDTKANKVVEKIPTGTGAGASIVAATSDSVWILGDDRVTLHRLDPASNEVVASIRMPAGCASIAFGESALWIACSSSNKVLRVDPARNVVAKTIETSSHPIAIGFGAGSVWVLCEGDGKISRIDPKENKVSATIDLATPGVQSGSIAFADGFVWVSTPGFPITKIAAEGNKVVQQFYGADGGGTVTTGFGSVWLAQGNKILRFDPKRIAATLAED